MSQVSAPLIEPSSCSLSYIRYICDLSETVPLQHIHGYHYSPKEVAANIKSTYDFASSWPVALALPDLNPQHVHALDRRTRPDWVRGR